MTAEAPSTPARPDPNGRSSATGGRGSLRLAVALWLAAAFVTWNVVFDRQLALEAARFASQNVLLHQQGRPTPTIDAGFRPLLPVAAVHATFWGGAVLAAGGVTLVLARRRAGPSRTA